MCDRVDEAVVLLVSTNFAYQEAGVQNEAGDHPAEKDNAQENFDVFLPIQNDPAEADTDRCRGKQYSKGEKEGDLAAPGNAHY